MRYSKNIELNISSERALSKLSENQIIIEIGPTVRKLLLFKELYPWNLVEVGLLIVNCLYLVHVMYCLTSQLYTSSCFGFAPSRNPKSEHAARIFPVAPPSPSLSFRSSSSGSMDLAVAPPPVQKTTPISEVGREWGHVSNLHGLISSLCLFADAVSANAIKILHRRGT